MAFDFPNSPAEGQVFNAPGGPSYVFQSPTWRAVGQGQIAIISDTAPTNPANGALWYESDTGLLFIWYNDGTSSQWVQVGGIIAPVPAIKLIQSGVLTGASIDIILIQPIAEGYTSFQLRWSQWAVASNDAMPTMRFSTNGGSSFLATGYTGQTIYALGSAPTAAAGSAASATYIQLANAINVSGGSSAGTCDFWQSSEWAVQGKATGSTQGMSILHGVGHNAYGVNAIRLMPSTGNFGGGGNYTLYGYRTS